MTIQFREKLHFKNSSHFRTRSILQDNLLIIFQIQQYVNRLYSNSINRIMDSFTTPIKDFHTNPSKHSKTISQTREGDWVCLNCNNLNFSFRKKCNRCRTQTREQNQFTSAYSYYYFNKPLHFGNENQGTGSAKNKIEQCKKSTSSKDAQKVQNILTEAEMKTPVKIDYSNQTPTKKDKENLPSVSPLLKKYHARDIMTTGDSKNRSIFENEGLWHEITTKDFDECVRTVAEEDYNYPQTDNQELQKFISNIIL